MGWDQLKVTIVNAVGSCRIAVSYSQLVTRCSHWRQLSRVSSPGVAVYFMTTQLCQSSYGVAAITRSNNCWIVADVSVRNQRGNQRSKSNGFFLNFVYGGSWFIHSDSQSCRFISSDVTAELLICVHWSKYKMRCIVTHQDWKMFFSTVRRMTFDTTAGITEKSLNHAVVWHVCALHIRFITRHQSGSMIKG